MVVRHWEKRLHETLYPKWQEPDSWIDVARKQIDVYTVQMGREPEWIKVSPRIWGKLLEEAWPGVLVPPQPTTFCGIPIAQVHDLPEGVLLQLGLRETEGVSK